MPSRHLAATVLWTLCLTGGAPDAPRGAQAADMPFRIAEDRVRDRIDRIVIDEGVPSISVAAVKGDGPIWVHAAGLADKETGRPATPATPYRLASVSKPITAVAAMLLADRGVIDIDAPANAYLGAQKIVAHAGRADDVTVRRLMSHRGGLPLHYNLIHAGEAHTRRSLDETIARYGKAMLPPGVTHRYSNVGYAVLERIIEIQSGQSYDAFLRTAFFTPLGMTSAGVVTAPVHPKGAAIPYTRAGERYPAYDMDTRGAGGVFMTARDLVAFGRFFNDALDGKSDLLSQSAARTMLEMQSPTEPDDLEWYTLGWVHELRGKNREHDTIYHLGSTPGVRAELWLYPDADLVVATLVNEMSWRPLKRAREAVVAAILSDIAFIPYPGIHIAQNMQARWTGTADLGEDGRLPVTVEFQNPARPRVTVGGTAATVTAVRTIADGFISITATGVPLPVADVKRQNYELGFIVRPDGDSLTGYVAANRIAARLRDSGNFSFPVRLERTSGQETILGHAGAPGGRTAP